MYPGVADAAEGEQVARVVVRGIAVKMVNVEVFASAADGALLSVAIQDRVPYRFPSRQGILIPHPDGDLEPFAVDGACGPHGERALVTEPAETVPVGVIVAEGVL
ncbi:MAG: hypothetical protein PWR21_1360 [Methanoculleus sp.]|nr:hypothetical protein [Methanoculleus sp.]